MPYVFFDSMSVEVVVEIEGDGEGACVTRKVLCESWVAESWDDAIVCALSASQIRSGFGSHGEVSL